MKKRKPLVIFLLIFIFLFSLSSCGKATDSESFYTTDELSYGFDDGYVKSANSDSGDLSISIYDEEDIVVNNSNVKLIYRADISLSSEKFNDTIDEIKEILSGLNGYIEYSSIDDESSYYSSRTAQFTFRVPTENYVKFVDQIGDSCHVLSIEESVEDIGQSYYEVETHIETLKIKIERFHELLKEATNMADIIEITNALSDAEYELEQYQSTLNKYDSLINYSTISVTLYEIGDAIYEKTSFFDEIYYSFLEGLHNFLSFLEEVAYFIVRNIIVILVLVILFIVLNKKFKFVKKIKECFTGKQEINENEKKDTKNI